MAPPTHQNNHAAEAARYALLRRLAACLLHDMAGALQPLGMTAAIMEKRLQPATPDLISLGKSCASFKALSRDAAEAFAYLNSWLAPRSDQWVALNTGVQEIMRIIARELSDRGFEIANETTTITVMLPQTVLRSVFIAALIAVTDSAESPGRLLVTSGVPTIKNLGNAEVIESDEISLTISLTGHPQTNTSIGANFQPYRKLDWDDVQALAIAENVGIERTAHGITLHVKSSGSAA